MSAAIDKVWGRRTFSKVADNTLATIVGERLGERLEYINIKPQLAADVGGDGSLLQTYFLDTNIVALDFSLSVLRCGIASHHNVGCRVLADARFLPLALSSLDVLWANLCFDWTDMKQALSEAARALKPETGLLIFSVLGPDTLQEARTAFIEAELCSLIPAHVFMDMHNIGDMLLSAGFGEPVLETERLTLTYATAADALREARNLGGKCALRKCRGGPIGRQRWQSALAAYTRLFADKAGRVPATYEVVYAVAWRKKTAQQEAVIKFI